MKYFLQSHYIGVLVFQMCIYMDMNCFYKTEIAWGLLLHILIFYLKICNMILKWKFWPRSVGKPYSELERERKRKMAKKWLRDS